MSCNGCRVLRKGCSENCMLRQCLQSIQTPQAQGYATLFVAKFFGRAGLLSFVSAVPQHQRPALFQSLLYEAVGRTINPVGGAVGLLWTGNWHLCQSAVETVLHGGALHALPEFTNKSPNLDNTSESEVDYLANSLKRKRSEEDDSNHVRGDLDLSLMSPAPERRADTLSDGSETTTSSRSGSSSDGRFEPEGREREAKLLRLFF